MVQNAHILDIQTVNISKFLFLLHIALTSISNFIQFTLHYQKQQERLKQLYSYLVYIMAELTQLSSRVQLYCGSQALSV